MLSGENLIKQIENHDTEHVILIQTRQNRFNKIATEPQAKQFVRNNNNNVRGVFSIELLEQQQL